MKQPQHTLVASWLSHHKILPWASAVTQILEVFSKHQETDNAQSMLAQAFNPGSWGRRRAEGVRTAWSTEEGQASLGYTETENNQYNYKNTCKLLPNTNSGP